MKFSQRVSIAATLVVLFLCVSTISAQETPPVSGTGKLAKVNVHGSQRYAEEAVAAATGLAIGQAINRDEMQAAADRLSSLGLFQNVRYNFRSQKESVEIVFQLEDAQLYPVFYDNFPWFTDEEINAAIKLVAPLFNGMVPAGGSVVDAATDTLQKLLPTRKVEGKILRELIGQITADGMMMRFMIEGPSLKVGAVQFEDQLAAADQRVRVQAQELVGKPYSRFAVELFVNEHVRPLYDERGHLRAQYGRAMARFTGDPNKPLADNVLVLVAIQPRGVYRWAGATWTGNAAFGPAALNALVPLPAGEPANGNTILKLWQNIEAEYGRRGYIEVKLTPKPRYDETNMRVHYEVQIDEGAVYRMGELVITGLSALAKRKLTEAWTLEKGSTFNRTYLMEFLASCESKKVFGEYVVHYDEVGHMLQPKPGRLVDVMIDFK